MNCHCTRAKPYRYKEDIKWTAVLFRSQKQPKHGWGVWLHRPGNWPYRVHSLRSISYLEISGPGLLKKVKLHIIDSHFSKYYIQECSQCLGRKFSIWTGICCTVQFTTLLKLFWRFSPQTADIQKQVLWGWVCLLDSSGGAFHQVWRSCPWWELWKGKVSPHITVTFGFQQLLQMILKYL